MNAYEAVLHNNTHFSLDEWPEPDILKKVEGSVILNLSALRELHGSPIHPSQNPNGWARVGGSTTSRHYAVGRLSDAADFFPEGRVLDCWLTAVSMKVWGGFGLYLDTNKNPRQPGAMMHLDQRPGPRVFWIRNEVGTYIYKHRDPEMFWEALHRVGLK